MQQKNRLLEPVIRSKEKTSKNYKPAKRLRNFIVKLSVFSINKYK
ncbi:MAG: hypothetical protein CH104c_0819 [Candidatus Woesebacteria bacterium]|nr:MAG: hypothetical protein CH104c_0819 [Candidatus Woesebacteria bacterium]